MTKSQILKVLLCSIFFLISLVQAHSFDELKASYMNLWHNVSGGYPCNVSTRVLQKQCWVGEIFEVTIPFDDWKFIHFYNEFVPNLTDNSSLVLLSQDNNCLRFKAVKPGKCFFCTISKNIEEWRSPVWGRLITQYFEDDYIVEVADSPVQDTASSSWDIKKGNDFYVSTQVKYLQCVVGDEFEVLYNEHSQKFINANTSFDNPKEPALFPYIWSGLVNANDVDSICVIDQSFGRSVFKAIKPGATAFCTIDKMFSCSTLFSLHCEYCYCPNQDFWLDECVYLIEVVEPGQEHLSAFVIMTNA